MYVTPKFCISIVSSFSWAILTPRKTEDNGYAKFWGDKQRALWSVMVFSVEEVAVNWLATSFPGLFGSRFYPKAVTLFIQPLFISI